MLVLEKFSSAETLWHKVNNASHRGRSIDHDFEIDSKDAVLELGKTLLTCQGMSTFTVMIAEDGGIWN